MGLKMPLYHIFSSFPNESPNTSVPLFLCFKTENPPGGSASIHKKCASQVDSEIDPTIYVNV